MYFSLAQSPTDAATAGLLHCCPTLAAQHGPTPLPAFQPLPLPSAASDRGRAWGMTFESPVGAAVSLCLSPFLVADKSRRVSPGAGSSSCRRIPSCASVADTLAPFPPLPSSITGRSQWDLSCALPD